jgi:hypothetical protein
MAASPRKNRPRATRVVAGLNSLFHVWTMFWCSTRVDDEGGRHTTRPGRAPERAFGSSGAQNREGIRSWS